MSHHYDAATALVVVDVQNDFADPGGSLYVHDGEAVVAPLNDEIDAARSAGATVVLTQDWHPMESPHFTDGGGTWPRHCVRGTWGAELHHDLNADADLLLRKGTGGEDGYSAFTVIDPRTAARSATGLAAYLDARGVTSVVIGGLAADVCVKATATDAHDAGFVTTVLWSMTRAVEIEPGDGDRARMGLVEAGVTVAG
ncbi:MAG: isochorismatase family protein [Acidimicrobiales bacterium]